MNNNKSGFIAFLGIMSALTFGLLALETQVLSGILPVTPCYLSLPLAVSLSIYRKDFKGMFIGGTVFGVCSFILSFVFGLSWFMNPLISVLPRVMFGLTSGFTFIFISKLTAKSEKRFIRETLPCSVSGIVGAVTNTVLVVLGFFTFGFQGLKEALTAILSFNALIEIVCCALLVPTLTNITRKYYKINGNR